MKRIVYTLLLSLISCGRLETNIKALYHGPELMETVDCIWSSIQPIVNTIHLHKEFYSDGSDKANCDTSTQSSDTKVFCTGYSDVNLVDYLVIVNQSPLIQVLYENAATCTKTFTDAKPN